jgi:hypothetical protein
MFKVTDNKGFHMTFDNGFTVSVQWGVGNYCDNKWGPGKFGGPVPDCRDAEVAAFDADGNFVTMSDGEDVKGYLSANEVLAFMNAVAGLSNEYVPDQLRLTAE